jgi:hypothetical protein
VRLQDLQTKFLHFTLQLKDGFRREDGVKPVPYNEVFFKTSTGFGEDSL